MNSCPKEKLPGSPRTFSTVPYPRTSSLRAKRRPPLSLSFFHSAYFDALFRQSSAKLKRFANAPYPLDERERDASFRFRVYGCLPHSFLLKSDALRLREYTLPTHNRSCGLAVSSKLSLFFFKTFNNFRFSFQRRYALLSCVRC